MSDYLRFTDKRRRRLSAYAKALGRKALEQLAGVVTPDTLLRWFRSLIARKYDGTVKRILNDHGIEPAPERKRMRTPWKTF